MYLGNNFHIIDGVLFNTKTQKLYEGDIPSALLYEKTAGNFQVCMEASEFPKKVGSKFVTFTYAEDYFFSSSGKSQYVKFNNLTYINNGWAEVQSKWLPFKYNFKLGNAYLLILVVDEDYPFGYRITNIKEI